MKKVLVLVSVMVMLTGCAMELVPLSEQNHSQIMQDVRAQSQSQSQSGDDEFGTIGH